MNIRIEFIQAKLQRYRTTGDWKFDDAGDLVIRVSNDDPTLPTEDEQILVALHELVEVLLCRKRGITQAMVDDFDIHGVGSEYCQENGIEPGDHPEAPYRREHRFAMIIEHLMAHELGLAGYGEIK